MNDIKPQDRPKVIGLLLAVLAVFGFGGVNILKQTGAIGGSSKSDTTPPATDTTTVAEAPAPATVGAPAPTPAPPAAVGTNQVATAAPTVGQVLQPLLNDNPFRPITAPSATPTPVPVATPVATASGQWAAAKVGSLPRFTPPPPGSVGGAAPGAAVLPAPREEPMELVGVISGGSAMAMIRSGTQDQFVKVGERVGAFKVARIGTDDLTLRHGNTVRILRVGVPGVVEFTEATLPAARSAAAPTKGKRTAGRRHRRGRHGSRWAAARQQPRPMAPVVTQPQFAGNTLPAPVVEPAPVPPAQVIVIPTTPAAPPVAPEPIAPLPTTPAADPAALPATATPSPTPAPTEPQPVQDTGMPTPPVPQSAPDEKSEG